MLQIRKIKVLKHCDPFKTNFMGLNGQMAEFFFVQNVTKTANVPFLTHFQLSSSWPHYLSILAS